MTEAEIAEVERLAQEYADAVTEDRRLVSRSSEEYRAKTLAALLATVRRLASPPREALRRAAQSMLDATDVEWFGVFTGAVELTAAQGERITNARAALRAALASPPAPAPDEERFVGHRLVPNPEPPEWKCEVCGARCTVTGLGRCVVAQGPNVCPAPSPSSALRDFDGKCSGCKFPVARHYDVLGNMLGCPDHIANDPNASPSSAPDPLVPGDWTVERAERGLRERVEALLAKLDAMDSEDRTCSTCHRDQSLGENHKPRCEKDAVRRALASAPATTTTDKDSP